MIKVVHIAKPIGGVGVYIQLLAKTIDSNLYEHIIIQNKNDKNLKIVTDKEELIKRYHVNLIREIKPINDILSLIECIRILKKEKPNLIHCHSAKAGILGRLAAFFLKIPVLYTPHAYSYLSTNSYFKKTIFKLTEQLFKHLPGKTLACSQSEYYRTINDLKFDPNKVFLWNNAIDEIKPVANKIDYNLPENYICNIGRPSYQKNTELLINSIYQVKKDIPNIHLVILGVGYYAPSLKKVTSLINDLNLTSNVTLISFINRQDCLAILEKSNLFVSTSRYEGLPYAGIEALMLKKACVLSDVDGHKDLIDNTVNGYLTEQNTSKIAEKIKYLLTNHSVRKKMEEASYTKFQRNFVLKNNYKKLENIYKSVAKR